MQVMLEEKHEIRNTPQDTLRWKQIQTTKIQNPPFGSELRAELKQSVLDI